MEQLVNEANIDELLQAQTFIWNQTYQFLKSLALKCAVQLGIPDVIHHHGHPMPLSELVLALQVHPTKTHHLYRLMRVLVYLGFFESQNDSENHCQERYILTPASRFLLKDSPIGSRPFVSVVLDPILREYNYPKPFLQNNDFITFFTAFGETVWSYSGHEPGFNHAFNEAMASDSLFIGRAVIIKCKEVFEGLNSLVDVGGGTGNMAKAISQSFPNLNCTVLELPHVVAKLQGSNNLSFVCGDMFQAVPPADAILLKWVLHDWGDEQCIKILKNCKEAISKKGIGGKLIIIEMVMGSQAGNDSSIEAELLFDLAMMHITEGKERNEKEWAKLFVDAGFSNYKVYPLLGIRALIEVYP